MADELQAIVDSLASRLDRAVAVEDRNLKVLAYSRHVGPVDGVRLTSILRKQAPPDVRRAVLALGIAEMHGAVHLAAQPALEMEARVVAPIRSSGSLLGYLWLVDPEQSLEETALATVARAADALGTVLHRQQLISELELGREGELLRDLVNDDGSVRTHAAARLLEANLFVDRSRVSVLAVTTVAAEDANEAIRVALGTAFERVRRILNPRHRLHLVRPDHGLLVVASKDDALRAGGVLALAAQLRDAVVEATAHLEDARVLVGIGDEQPALVNVLTSYRQALRALHIGRIVRSFGSIVAWSDLGIYRLLSQLPVEQVLADVVDPGLARLLESSSTTDLVRTLETYLDCGCDAKATSSALTLHRASLYYRLHKIEEITGSDLKAGDDRLALHLGLKLARIAGLHPEGV